MVDRVAAELVLFLHFLFVAFAVLGGILVLLNRRWLWLHLPAVMWASIVNFASWTCPLTPVEQDFRRAAGQAGYSGGFIEHYIGPIVYPAGMPRSLELLASVSIVVWNVIVYATIIIIARRRKRVRENAAEV